MFDVRLVFSRGVWHTCVIFLVLGMEVTEHGDERHRWYRVIYPCHRGHKHLHYTDGTNRRLLVLSAMLRRWGRHLIVDEMQCKHFRKAVLRMCGD